MAEGSLDLRLLEKLQEQFARAHSSEAAEGHSGGGGGGGGGGQYQGNDMVDAKIAAAEARTDKKFADLLGQLQLLNLRLDHVDKATSGVRGTIIGTGVAIVAIVIAVMAYGAQWFGIGIDAQQLATRAANTAIETTAGKMQPQIDLLNSNYDELNQKLDLVIRALGAPAPQNDQGLPAPQRN